MSDIAIRAANLSKLYHIGRGQGKAGYRTLRESMMGWAIAPLRWFSRDGRASADDTIWALKDVSFEVKRGEVVGIIGRNGAGKSTLLKILSRITDPTEGTVDLYGRVGSLLEVGTGFHPELTGRENIYLNGAILGMKRTEIIRKFDEIVDFSEIEKFLDTPVKHYSSGMYVRLAFAVAAHLDPEILLVDEVLAVGDAAFQKKCLGKLGDVAKEGRTVLFVSHNMGQIRSLCSQGILLRDGKNSLYGPIVNVISDYQRGLVDINSSAKIEGANYTGFTSWKIYGTTSYDSMHVIFSQEPFTLEIELQLENPVYNGFLTILLNSDDGQKIGGWKINGVRFDSGTYKINCRIPILPVRPGLYFWHLSLWDGGKKIDVATLYPELVVSTEDNSGLKDEPGAILNIPSDIEIVRI